MPVLIRHYEQEADLSQSDAGAVAEVVMDKLLARAAGAFPSSAVMTTPEIVKLARSDATTRDQLERALADPELQDGDVAWALRAALLEGRPDALVMAIIDARAERWKSRPAIFEPVLAFAMGRPTILQRLIDVGVPIDAQNEFGKTTLYYAIGNNDHQTAQFLLDHHADVNHTYRSARELRAVERGDCRYAQLTHTLRTPLMHAAAHGDSALVELLLRHGAQIDTVDEKGFNALDFALEFENANTAEILGSRGLSPNVKHGH